MAYKENGENAATGKDVSPPLADNGQPSKAEEKNQLNSQDLSILEHAIRERVSGLVNDLHPDVNGQASSLLSETDLDFRLHPELDAKARQLPAADKAIAFRERFLKSLIDPDPRHHREIIEELLQANIPMQTLAIHLFCPVATQLGTYWCNDETDFMQVAVASTRLNTIVNHATHAGAQLVNPHPSAKRVLLARSHGTKHTLGVTLVRMCFRDMGWIVDGGADMEIGDTLYMRLSSRPYHLLGLSIGQIEETADCKDAIERCRSEPATRDVKIALGGAAVVTRPDEFQNTGADVIARSALEVMHLAEYIPH
ncbi:cobalamin-dependent protein [Roseibium sp. HPY-6]|uniref:cobalamin B12-binding domain-containing protein n=1 Tax=Roseibium sp. HPY-6 TaxID=3229852 RepID=UPI00338D3BA3